MRSKEGFTLVELLAVIVILAIILAIAIPSITNIVTSSKLSGFTTSSKMLERAAKTYMSANNISVASGTTSYILYSDMKTAGYIGKVSDPTNNNECTHSGVYVTNNSGTYTYKGAVACDNYMDIDAYNIVTNGDFSNGTTGWTGQAATSSAASNILSETGNGASNIIRAYQNQPFVQNHIYYIRCKIRVTDTLSSSLALNYMNNTATVSVVTLNSPVQNQWYVLSGAFTAPAPTGTTRLPQIWASYADSATENGKVMQVDGANGVYTFDLTAIYGSGNEPTATQMDNIMSNMGK